MTIKYQRQMLTFGLSAKVAHILTVIKMFKHTIGPIAVKFQMEHPFDEYLNMTMWSRSRNQNGCRPNLIKESKGQWPWILVCSMRDMGPTKIVQVEIKKFVTKSRLIMGKTSSLT